MTNEEIKMLLMSRLEKKASKSKVPDYVKDYSEDYDLFDVKNTLDYYHNRNDAAIDPKSTSYIGNFPGYIPKYIQSIKMHKTDSAVGKAFRKAMVNSDRSYLSYANASKVVPNVGPKYDAAVKFLEDSGAINWYNHNYKNSWFDRLLRGKQRYTNPNEYLPTNSSDKFTDDELKQLRMLAPLITNINNKNKNNYNV